MTTLVSNIKKVRVEDLVVSEISKRIYDYSNRQFLINSLTQSFNEIGQREPIIVIPRKDKYLIIDGVLRYYVSKSLKLIEIDTIIVDFEPIDDLDLTDFIIHHNIRKQKTPKEKENEIRELLRIDYENSNPLRNKEERVQLVSELLGKGWGRNNVFSLEKLMIWCDNHEDYRDLIGRILSGEISISKGLFVKELYERNDFDFEKEKESKIVQKFLEGKYNQERVNNLISTYNTKKDIPLTKVQLGSYSSDMYSIIHGNSLTQKLPEKTKVDLSFTSIPYYQQIRYGGDKNEIGWEKTPQEFVSKIVSVFMNNIDNFKETSSIIINVNESFKDGECVGIVPMLIEEFKRQGLIYVQLCIWRKLDGKPSGNNVKRFLNSFEYLLIFSKTKNYFFDRIRIKDESKKLEVKSGCKEQGGKEKSYHISNNYRQIKDFVTENVIGDIMSLNITNERSQTQKEDSEFFGSFPNNFPLPFLLSFCPEGGTVWDPFTGTGTVGRQSLMLGRKFVGHELYEKNIPLILDILKKGESEFSKESLSQLNEVLGLTTTSSDESSTSVEDFKQAA